MACSISGACRGFARSMHVQRSLAFFFISYNTVSRPSLVFFSSWSFSSRPFCFTLVHASPTAAQTLSPESVHILHFMPEKSAMQYPKVEISSINPSFVGQMRPLPSRFRNVQGSFPSFLSPKKRPSASLPFILSIHLPSKTLLTCPSAHGSGTACSSRSTPPCTSPCSWCSRSARRRRGRSRESGRSARSSVR